MRGMNSETVDLIYLDPPYNSAKNYKGTGKAKNQEFVDNWSEKRLLEWNMLDGIQSSIEMLKEQKWFSALEMIKLQHSKAMYYYLSFMAIRIIEMHRVLKGSGSLYLHCDDSSNSYLRMIMDFVFGHKNGPGAEGRGAEINWKRSNPKNNTTSTYGRCTDTIYYYIKNAQPPIYNQQYTSLDTEYVRKNYKLDDNDGKGPYRLLPLSAGFRSKYHEKWRGFTPPPNGWVHTLETREKMFREGRIKFPLLKNGQMDYSKRLNYKKYLTESKGTPVVNTWSDISIESKTYRTGWETQKPLKLLTRIIKTSSNEGDLVFDPFCGCATTMLAASFNGRQFIGCDIDSEVTRIAEMRWEDQRDLLLEGNKDAPDTIKISTDIPVPSDGRSIQDYSIGETRKRIPVRRLYGYQIYAAQNGKCNLCRKSVNYKACDVVHIDRRKDSLSNEFENLQILCVECHRDRYATENMLPLD